MAGTLNLRHVFPTDLYDAAAMGDAEGTAALLSSGLVDVDEQDTRNNTALIYAASNDHSGVIRILLDKGASVSIADGGGYTPLHISCQFGHVASTTMLLEAGAPLEAKTREGMTPLYMAAQFGRYDALVLMIEAGANVNSRRSHGGTPLYRAAWNGHIDVIRLLLDAKADPLLTMTSQRSPEKEYVPLGAAATNGHAEVVRELIRRFGIEGCGGPTGGVEPLRFAAEERHVHIMTMLMDAGVVDTGYALNAAAKGGREASVKCLLLGRQERPKTSREEADYADTLDELGRTPLITCITTCQPGSPRVARLLVDAGADAASTVWYLGESAASIRRKGPLTPPVALVRRAETPLALTTHLLREKHANGKEATQEQLHRLQAIRRLLLRVEAVRAVSFLWPSGASLGGRAADGAGKTKTASTAPTPLGRMTPVLRERARRPGALLAPVFRWVAMFCDGLPAWTGCA